MSGASKGMQDLTAGEKRALLARRLAKRAGESRLSPLSFAQQRLWFLDQLEPGNPFYNASTALSIAGPLHAATLERAFNEIVRRHETLRTTFEVVEGEAAQRISPARWVPLPVEDLRHLPRPAREAEVLRLANEEVQKPFDLVRGPLWRLRLLRLGQGEHALFVTTHHIVSDAWSMVVFFRELEALYSAFLTGKPSPLQELPIQYADFSVWQREWLQGDVLERQLRYWERQLGGELPVLDLPTDRPRPAVQTYLGARLSAEIPATTADALRALSRQQGVTLFMTAFAAFQTLLYRYTGESDISVGTPIANRNRAETECLIGFFVNTLVLRTDLSGNPTFRELLGRVRKVALEAYDHQDLPFEKLIEHLDPERSLSHTPLFQVFFNMIQADDTPLNLPGLTVRRLKVSLEASKFDLTLYFIERTNGLTIILNYKTALFDAAPIRRMLAHFETLLESIVANPDRPLSRLALLTDSERLDLSGGRNRVCPSDAFVEFRKEEIERSLPARFEALAGRDPRRVAVKTAAHQWTYETLNGTAKRVAQMILGSGGPTGERIALLLEHDAPMVAALLGSLMADKTYVPLDPSYPVERLSFMLRDSEATSILTNNRNFSKASVLGRGGLSILNMDEPGDSVFSLPPGGLSIAPDALAYILYTSGSTGQPKGVMQTHRNVLHFVRAYTNALHVSREDKLTLLSSYSFDAAVIDIFGALLNGATLYPIAIAEEGFSGLADRLIREGITILHAVPSVYRGFVDSLNGTERFDDLRLMVLGGEEVYRSDVDSFRKHFPAHCLFVNLLGSTESTASLQYLVDRNTDLLRHRVPVGYPVEETEVLLLDGEGAPTELYGEIGIRSRFLSPGYWRRPDLTRAAFLSGSEGQGRIYRSGDMGRLLPEGEIQFLGRKDSQVKVRGFRVELGEIEAVLRGHPAVAEVAVLAREDPQGEKWLVAYVVSPEDPLPGSTELRRFLKEKLPESMVPSAFVMLESLPRLPNGKLDRRRLPAPEGIQPGAEKTFLPPRTPIEKLIGEVWTELLGVERVGLQDSFFELGGHSLLATRAIVRLRNALQLDLPLRVLFEAPTVAELAVAIAQRQAEKEEPGELARLLAEIEDDSSSGISGRPSGSGAQRPL